MPMPSRRVHLIAAGGTIVMSGEPAQPPRSTDQLAAALTSISDIDSVEHFSGKPSVQFTAAEALALARRACERAAAGDAVLITHGTDCLEEVALLTDLIYDGQAPIVFTGAMRPASSAGADGPTNLRDAVCVAAHRDTAELGVLVCFAGELHAAATVRKSDSVSPAAFSSPQTGPLGYVREDEVSILARPARRAPALEPASLDARVEVLVAGLASSGRLIDLAAAELDGLVLVVPGAGHAPPEVVQALARTAQRIPVVVVARPEHGALLRSTYGFEGSERDIRATGATCAAALSPAGARIKLMVCLGASLDRSAIARAFGADDV